MNPAEYEIMYRVEDALWWYIGLRSMIQDFLTAYAPSQSPHILDAGCGTGAVLKPLADLGRTADIDSQ
jgi:2-polyprenyl-3-methyl-5-hydroxy-6-metoxy-1,4-benzoquinol methylase